MNDATLTLVMALALPAAMLVTMTAACDPVQEDKVAALGGEAPGVRKGPLHRPGQPCIVCHDGALGNPPGFSVAGTIFLNPDSVQPAVGAVVALATSDGKTFKATTNDAGNFFVTPSELTPSYPMKVAVTYKTTTVNMQAHIGRDGSCAGCHTDPPGPTSAGHIFINAPNGVLP